MNLKTASLVSIFLLVGCDDQSRQVGAAQQPTVLRGRIVAPIISGLKYQSGSQSGVTDADGFFTYEQGIPVHFSAPGLDFPPIDIEAIRPLFLRLASAADTEAAAELANAKSYWESLILANNGYLPSEPVPPPPPPHATITLADMLGAPLQVVNAGRIFWFLDSDNDPSNGIQISAAMQAASVAPIDLNSGDIEGAAAGLRNVVMSVDGKANPWKTKEEVSSDLAARRICAFTGLYTGSMKSNAPTGSDSKWGFITAISLPPFGDITGFILADSQDVYPDGLFHYDIIMNTPQTTVTVPAVLRDIGDEWPTANVISGSSQMNLSLSWNAAEKLSGSWALDSANGMFDMNLIPDVSEREVRFPARWRFVYFPVRWESELGRSKYAVLVVEIDRLGKVSATLFDPRPGDYVFQLATMQGELSPYSDFLAIARGRWTGAEEWRFEAYFDRETMTLKTPYLYQISETRGIFLADDFQGNSMVGCAL